MSDSGTPFHEIVEKTILLLNGTVEKMKRVTKGQESHPAKRTEASKLNKDAQDLAKSLQLAHSRRNDAEAAGALRNARMRWIQGSSLDDLKKLVHAALETYEGKAAYVVEENNGKVTLTQIARESSADVPK